MNGPPAGAGRAGTGVPSEGMRWPKAPRLAAALGAAALVALGSAAAAPAAPAADPPACTARQLAAGVDSSSGAGGIVVLRVAVANRGALCRLEGSPTLRLRNHAAALPTRTVRGGMPLLQALADPVDLATGERAFLLVVYSTQTGGARRGTASAGSSACPDATHIDILVNGWRRPVSFAVKALACDGGRLRISPFLHAARPGGAAPATSTSGTARATVPASRYPGDL